MVSGFTLSRSAASSGVNSSVTVHLLRFVLTCSSREASVSLFFDLFGLVSDGFDLFVVLGRSGRDIKFSL